MHFGEFLVEQKLLSAHQILKALEEQSKRRAYVPRLMVDQGALPDYRALRMCTLADENHEDFLDVLVREKCVDEEQSRQIRSAWIKSGPHLGQVLVDMGEINDTILEAALEEFEPYKDVPFRAAMFSCSTIA